MTHLTYSKICSSSKRRLSSAPNILILLFVLALTAGSQAQTRAGSDLVAVRELVGIGEIDAARDLLWALPWSGSGYEWEVLNLRLTQDGKTARDLGNQLLEFDLNRDECCEVVVILAQDYLACGDYKLGLKLISDWKRECRDAARYSELTVMEARLRHELGQGMKSLKDLKKLLKEPSSIGMRSSIGMLVGDILCATNKYHDASAFFARVAQVSEYEMRGIALNRLEKCYRLTGKFENADLVATQMRSTCPEYARMYADSPALASIDENDATSRVELAQSPAVRRSGAGYAVRVGSFTDRVQAKTLNEQFRKQGYTTRMSSENSRGGIVHVVDIGRFTTASGAIKFMSRLQRQTRDTYSVVSL